MNVLSSILESAWAERIGWTLVHSVWQIALVTALFAIGALALRRSSANARYILGCLALLAMVAWPAATLITISMEKLEQPPSTATTATVATLPAMPTTAAADAVTFEAAPLPGLDAAPQPSFEVSTHDWAASWEIVVGVARRGPRRLEPALPWAAVSWVVGASLLALRPLRGLIVVRRLQTHGLAPLSTEVRRFAGQLMMRLRVHAAVQFAESALIEVPTVVGYFRPMVLLPASAVTGLSTAQLEMIVAHELAHIRRHDYLVNLLQTVIEALLFYHPGVWWVSSRVRREREHCCDDVAMTVCGNRSEYVRALYTLESRRQATAPALAASGGSLVERVRRIVRGPHRANRDDSAAAWWAGLIVLAVVTSVLALGLAYAEEPITETAQQDASSKPRTASEASTPTAERATLNGRIVYDGPRPEQPLLRIPLTLSYRRDGEQTETPELPERRRIAELGLKDESLIVGEDGGIANVVVWVRSKEVPAPRWSGPLPPATIRATEGRFEPHVLAFWNLAPLRWINASTEGVNFNWRPAANPGANRLIPASEEVSIDVPLRRPELQPTRLTSNLQPWMSAYILPLAHPYVAVTGSDGQFKIKNLPLGEWEFAVWHERCGWLSTDRFATGRFTWKIRPGENELGELRVAPQTMRGTTASKPPAEDDGAALPIDQLDVSGFSVLHRAASGGHIERVRKLLDGGANVNVEQGTYHGTPLQYAAFRGHGETVQALLDRGAKVDARDSNGRTPLVWAAMAGHADVAERLLDAGADINAANAGGWTPLRYAVDRGHESLAQLLIARGANVQATNSQGKLPGDLQPGTAKRAGELVESDRNALNAPAQVSADVAAAQQRVEASQEPLDPQRQPTDVVATVLGRDITAAEIEPPPQWYAERQKPVEVGRSREYDMPEVYRARRLAGLIAGPLFDEYRKQEKLEPTEEQITEFLKHHQLAKVRSQQERARELEQLKEEAAELEARLEARDQSEQDAAGSSKRLDDVRSQIATIEKASNRHGILAAREKQDRFFAEWQVQRWNLQASLYRRYGGRAVWQQAGNEALDAMRDYLREQERDGKFTIHDPSLSEQFWKIYAPEKLLFEIRDPDRVFEHPWSAFEPAEDPS